MARRLACALAKVASVATTTSVVLSRKPPLVRNSSASGGTCGGRPIPPNSLSCSNGAAQNQGPSPTTADPAALTTASAPTVIPSGVAADAEPSPPLRLTVVAPRPAPALPQVK